MQLYPPRAAADTVKGLSAPHTLGSPGPPRDARVATKLLSRTMPDGETGALLIGSPRLILGDELRRPAAGPEGESSRQQQRQTDAGAVHGAGRVQATLLSLR